MKKYNRILDLMRLLILVPTIGFANNGTLRQSFDHPSSEASPWVFWYWMQGAVSKAGITADLEAMQRVGLAGAYLMPIKGPSTPPVFEFAVNQMSPEWWDMVRHSANEADRLELKLGMHICDGFALAGGPWNTPATSMQKIVWADTIVIGGNHKSLKLPQPEMYEGFYNDISIWAIPVEGYETSLTHRPVITSNADTLNYSFLSDMSLDGLLRSNDPCWIQYDFGTPFTCRSIEITASGTNFQSQRLQVTVSEDGVNFVTVKNFTPPRHGWQNTDQNATHIIPATTARYFRFNWTPAGTPPGAEDLDAAKWRPNLRLKRIVLSEEARIEHFEGKAGYIWRVAPRTSSQELPDNECIDLDKMIELTDVMQDGLVSTVLPKGKWKLLRIGHTATGHTNATGGGGKGLECNKFDPKSVRLQLDRWFEEAFRQIGDPVAHRVIKYMHVDSWECGSQNWSSNFNDEFKLRRGYSLLPYLPVMTGLPIRSAEFTESILHDVRQTIAELVVDQFYAGLKEVATKHNCELSAECVSPTMVSDGMLHYQTPDLAMGEFWLQSPTHDKPNDMLDAISAAHIYGKKIVQAEGFTQLRIMWDEHPAMLRTLQDRNYALGINRMFYHVFVHNPWIDKAPGMTLDGIGLYMQRDQTWWEPGKAWIDYAKRTQAMLQYGDHVADIAVFTGEDTPRRAILPDRLVSSLPGIFGEERVEEEKRRMANEQLSIREMPVKVFHSANMADPEDWTDALNGYSYDSFNKDALLRLVRTENGRMVLPGGASYRVLVLPKPHALSPDCSYMSVEVATKIRELQQAGVVVLLGDKPYRVPQMLNQEEDTKRLQHLVSEIWSVDNAYKLPYVEEDFSQFGLSKDVVNLTTHQKIAWTHRREKLSDTDLYFVSNQQNGDASILLSFRVADRKPQIWDAVTAEIYEPASWRVVNGRTEIMLDFAAAQSLFVVFEPNTSTPLMRKQIKLVRPFVSKEWSISMGDKQFNRSELFDWSKDQSPEIKYFSGTANYETSFKFEKLTANQRVYLDMGKVAVMATVTVNGVPCGTAWCYPYRVEITNALKKGENKLLIEVVNTWANRIKGVDDKIIEDPKVWTNSVYRKAGEGIVESGLMGPLKWIIEQ